MNLTDDQVSLIREKLGEIAEKKGCYSMDRFEHAGNVIDDNAKRAEEILAILKGAT